MTPVISSVSPAPAWSCTARPAPAWDCIAQVRQEPYRWLYFNRSRAEATLELTRGPHVTATDHPRSGTLDDDYRRDCHQQLRESSKDEDKIDATPSSTLHCSPCYPTVFHV